MSGNTSMVARMLLFTFLISSVSSLSVTRTIPIKLFQHENVCDDMYGTVLGHHFKLQHPLHLGLKCATDPLCNSAIYDYLGNYGQRNSDFFDNRTDVGCTNFVSYIYISTELEPRVIPIDHCPIPKNTERVEYTNMPTSMSPIGTEIPYVCHPCTYFPPVGSSATVTCMQDGTWSAATCHFGRDVGHLFDGTPIPAGAIGCNHTVAGTCSINEVIGLTMDGYQSMCYCDDICCSGGDCCYDSMCHDDYTYHYYYY